MTGFMRECDEWGRLLTCPPWAEQVTNLLHFRYLGTTNVCKIESC